MFPDYCNMSRTPTPSTYELRIRGRLSGYQLAALGGMEADFSESITTVIVDVADRAALHAVLARVEDLALVLVAVAATRRSE